MSRARHYLMPFLRLIVPPPLYHYRVAEAREMQSHVEA